ncbi:MAG: alpha/beta hydrolase [Fimbriimonadaceae bacterium]|nr:alpha/beta hydrolase [Fimbriimonadaceae bacterium]
MSVAFLCALAALSPVSSVKDIVYSTSGTTPMMADLYTPEGDSATPRPLVIVIHGGSWMTGNRNDMAGTCNALATAGFASATVSYRLAPANKWPAMIDDVQTAVRYFRENAVKYNVDPNRIAALGVSAGGHLALLTGSMATRDTAIESKTDSKTKVVINIFGPTDMTQDFAVGIANLLSQQVLGKPYAEATDIIKQFSPITYITKDSAPTFTIHGDADTLVPVRQAERLKEALDKAGVVNDMVIVKGMGHEDPMGKPGGPEAIAKAYEFLKANL